MREYQDVPSNFRATGSLADFLQQYGVLGIEGFDTRMLTRILRDWGEERGARAIARGSET